MDTTNNEELEIDLREILGLLRSKLWIIILVTIISAGAVGVGSKLLLTPIYTSTTKLYIVNKSPTLTSLSLSDLQMGSQLTKDYMVLVKSRPVIEQVIKNIGLDMTYEQLVSSMSTNNPVDTRILEISVEYPDAFLAKEIVDEIAQVSAKRIALIMDMDEPNIFEEGHMATNPTKPTVKKNAVIAGIIGMVLVTLIICVLYITDDTIKSSEDIERYLGINTIGLIPIEAGELEAASHKKKKKKRSGTDRRQK